MIKSFKTEINPTCEQKIIIDRNIGICRFAYNFYISYNKELHEAGEKIVGAKEFKHWLLNDYLSMHPECVWIKEASSKSLTKSIDNAAITFMRYINGYIDFPKYKKKGINDAKMYFVKTNPNDCLVERHRIKIPTLDWVKIKEKGYIPTSKSGCVIKSGTVSCVDDRYYVSVIAYLPDDRLQPRCTDGIGIDLGLLNFAVVSNGITYPNINKSYRLIKLQRQIERAQKSLSRKYENLKKGGTTQRKNIQKQKFRIHKLHHKINDIRNDYLNKVIADVVKDKPSYITVEDLNVKGMAKNKYLSAAVSSQKLYTFRTKLKKKCKELNIELRIADKWFPSSRMCHNCGRINNDLKLEDREFSCSCGYHNDRDLNASLNLRDTINYVIA